MVLLHSKSIHILKGDRLMLAVIITNRYLTLYLIKQAETLRATKYTKMLIV